MAHRPVATCLVRNQSKILRLRPATDESVVDWGGLTATDTSAPDAVFDQFPEIRDHCTLIRDGKPVTVACGPHGDPATVHPYLYDCRTRHLDVPRSVACEWVSPVTTRSTADSEWVWSAYERVWPTPETIAADTTHGASYLSCRALEVLRDRAAVGRSAEQLRSIADRLCEARPAMAVVRNRINRVMAAEQPIGAIIADEIERAHSIDRRAGVAATTIIDAETLLTLSRSGTVRSFLDQWQGSLFVLESRPGGEGKQVVTSLEGELLPDTAAAHALATTVDAVVVGADTVYPDGSIVNKLGTRGVAITAKFESVPVYAIATSDKITAESPPTSSERSGLDPLPLFDHSPADCVAVITEAGLQSPSMIETVSKRHEERASWRTS